MTIKASEMKVRTCGFANGLLPCKNDRININLARRENRRAK
jgi:hypothetical protein